MVFGPIKKRMWMSFGIGFGIMLIIAVIGFIILYMQYDRILQEKETLENDLTTVCVTSRAISINEEITSADLIEKRINTNAIPNNAYFSKASFDTSNTKYAKIALEENTILVDEMFFETEILTDDMRVQEFNMLLLPSQLKENDYVDIRLLLPTGNDYVVCSKKRVQKSTEGTIWLYLGEVDMQYTSSAIIESYLTEGSILYAIEYVTPGLQEAAKVTYPILPAVEALIRDNPNLVEQVKDELGNRLSSYEKDRTILDSMSEGYKPEDPVEVLTQKVLEQIQNQVAERAYNSGI